MADSGLISTISLLAVMGALFYENVLSRKARARRSVQQAPKHLRDRSHQEVHVTGVVHARGQLLRAPVSGRPCLAYELQVDLEEKSTWTRVVERSEAVDFVVAAATGEVLVDTTEPIVVFALEWDRRGSTSWYEKIDEGAQRAVEELLSSKGVTLNTWTGDRVFRYREGVLEEGETVSVRGIAIRVVDERAQPIAPRTLPSALVLRGTVDTPLIISDAPKAIVE
jgi:hypothetical protein